MSIEYKIAAILGAVVISAAAGEAYADSCKDKTADACGVITETSIGKSKVNGKMVYDNTKKIKRHTIRCSDKATISLGDKNKTAEVFGDYELLGFKDIAIESKFVAVLKHKTKDSLYALIADYSVEAADAGKFFRIDECYNKDGGILFRDGRIIYRVNSAGKISVSQCSGKSCADFKSAPNQVALSFSGISSSGDKFAEKTSDVSLNVPKYVPQEQPQQVVQQEVPQPVAEEPQPVVQQEVAQEQPQEIPAPKPNGKKSQKAKEKPTEPVVLPGDECPRISNEEISNYLRANGREIIKKYKDAGLEQEGVVFCGGQANKGTVHRVSCTSNGISDQNFLRSLENYLYGKSDFPNSGKCFSLEINFKKGRKK